MVTAVYCSSVKRVLSHSRSTSRRSPTLGSEACWALVLRSWQCWAPSSCMPWASISMFGGQETLGETTEKGVYLQQLSQEVDGFLPLAASSQAPLRVCKGTGQDRLRTTHTSVCVLRGMSPSPPPTRGHHQGHAEVSSGLMGSTR